VAIAKTLDLAGRILIVLEGESLVNDATALIGLGFSLPQRTAWWACFWALFKLATLLPPDGARLASGSPKARGTDLAPPESLFIQGGTESS
jgi:hypothetical protein